MKVARPFSFGIVAGSAASAGEWRNLARKAEELGYASLLVPDHFNDQLGPLVALAVVAESTKSLRVGTSVLDNDFRHPAVLAKEIATLDVLSGGRVELGLGAGWQALDYERTGLSFDPPARRVERLKEAVAVYRGLFAPGPFSFDGRYYKLRDYDAYPKPVQSPLPIMIGAGGRRMLNLAASQADIVNLVPKALPQGGMDFADTSAEAFEKKVEIIEVAARSRPDRPEVATLVHRLFVTDSASEAEVAATKVAAAFGAPPDAALESPLVLIGPPSYMIDKLWERRQRFGLTYLSVLAHNVDAFAPVVAALAGKGGDSPK